MDSSKVKKNRFSPPFVARYIRIQPVSFALKPALRLELMGCDLNSESHQQQQDLSSTFYCMIFQRMTLLRVFVCPGCSLPLGLQNKLNDSSFDASSYYSSLLSSWTPNLARLHQEGRANAWRPKVNTNTQIP